MRARLEIYSFSDLLSRFAFEKKSVLHFEKMAEFELKEKPVGLMGKFVGLQEKPVGLKEKSVGKSAVGVFEGKIWMDKKGKRKDWDIEEVVHLKYNLSLIVKDKMKREY